MLTTAWDIINYVGNRQVIYKIIQYRVFAPNPLCQTMKSPHKDNHSMPKSSNHRETSHIYHRELNTINEISTCQYSQASRIAYATDLVNALLTDLANPRMNTIQTRAMENAELKTRKSKNRIWLYRKFRTFPKSVSTYLHILDPATYSPPCRMASSTLPKNGHLQKQVNNKSCQTSTKQLLQSYLKHYMKTSDSVTEDCMGV